MNMDSATEYEKNAHVYLRARDKSLIGYKVIQQWTNKLPIDSEVIEIACGGGYPVTKELSKARLKIWAIDSSKTLLKEFRKRFPNIKTKCEKVQDSNFFGKKFDAAISIGLIFLLSNDEQEEFIKRISNILNPNGKFLFMAPTEVGTWYDLNTGVKCTSLGLNKYKALLKESGFKIISTIEDVGENNYYEVKK